MHMDEFAGSPTEEPLELDALSEDYALWFTPAAWQGSPGRVTGPLPTDNTGESQEFG